MEKIVRKKIDDYDLGEQTRIFGFSKNLSEFFEISDLLVFATHLNAAGRPVFEAAFHKVPALVACNSPMDDTMVHRVSGLIIPTPNPELIANQVESLVNDNDLLRKIQAGAFELANRNFNIEVNAKEVIELYKDIC